MKAKQRHFHECGQQLHRIRVCPIHGEVSSDEILSELQMRAELADAVDKLLEERRALVRKMWQSERSYYRLSELSEIQSMIRALILGDAAR